MWFTQYISSITCRMETSSHLSEAVWTYDLQQPFPLLCQNRQLAGPNRSAWFILLCATVPSPSPLSGWATKSFWEAHFALAFYRQNLFLLIISGNIFLVMLCTAAGSVMHVLCEFHTYCGQPYGPPWELNTWVPCCLICDSQITLISCAYWMHQLLQEKI